MTITEILQKAAERARQVGLPYSGALTPAEAYEVWRGVPGAQLIDVRTRAEWDYVGRIPGAVELELLTYPGNQRNTAFVPELESKADKAAPVLFICRSGGRSHHAAMLAAQAGYSASYNVLEGFEGQRNHVGHRGELDGWRRHGLPWTQD